MSTGSAISISVAHQLLSRQRFTKINTQMHLYNVFPVQRHYSLKRSLIGITPTNTTPSWAADYTSVACIVSPIPTLQACIIILPWLS